MFDTRKTAKALVRAFNVNNRFSDTVETNFTLWSMGEKDYLVVSFDKDMDRYQCDRYLDSIKRKVIREFYGTEENNDEEIFDTAKLIFDIKSFPCDISKGELLEDKQHGFKFAIRVDEGVIFNLKSHLAFSLKKDVQEDMSIYITAKTFDKKEYLWCGEFPDKKSCQQFERGFLSRMNERYENVPDNLLKVKGNDVYIRNVFDDARFIDSITQRNALLIGRSLQANSKNRSDVKEFKNLIIEFINQSTGLIVIGFMCAPPLNGKGASILIPVILDSKGPRALTNEEALSINDAFYGIAFSDVDGKTHAELPVNGSSGIYGIDFYNPQVSYCVVTKIIESSVINKDHRLTIDPELPFQSWSRSPSTDMSDTDLESPKRNQGKQIRESPRRDSKIPLLPIDSSNRSRQSLSAAAVDDGQGACGGSPSFAKGSDEYSKAESKEDRAKSESPKKHGGGWFCKERSKSNSSSGSNTPSESLEPSMPNTGDRTESKSPENKQNLLQRTWSRLSGGSNKSSKENSPEESAPPVKNESQLLKPETPIRKISTGSQKSDDSGFKSSGPSPRLSFYEGSPDTSGGIKKQLPFIPFPQTQLTGPSSFSAMQYTGTRKKVIDESDICPANPWAVPGTAAFVPVSVSHVKSNIDKLGENFSRAIKVTEEGKLGSSEPEYGHQWLDRERHRRSTKQVTKGEPTSNHTRQVKEK